MSLEYIFVKTNSNNSVYVVEIHGEEYILEHDLCNYPELIYSKLDDISPVVDVRKTLIIHHNLTNFTEILKEENKLLKDTEEFSLIEIDKIFTKLGNVTNVKLKK